MEARIQAPLDHTLGSTVSLLADYTPYPRGVCGLRGVSRPLARGLGGGISAELRDQEHRPVDGEKNP